MRSGLRKRSKIKSNLIGSRSVIRSTYETSRPDGRAAPRAHRNIAIAGVFDEVPHDEKIRWEAHRLDDAELVFEPFDERRIGRSAFHAVALVEPIAAKITQVFGVGHRDGGGRRRLNRIAVMRAGECDVARREQGVGRGEGARTRRRRFDLQRLEVAVCFRQRRHGIERNVELLLGDLDVDSLDDLERVVARFRHVREEFAHLERRLDVEFVRHEFHAARVLHGFARADTEQHVVRLRVPLVEIIANRWSLPAADSSRARA